MTIPPGRRSARGARSEWRSLGEPCATARWPDLPPPSSAKGPRRCFAPATSRSSSLGRRNFPTACSLSGRPPGWLYEGRTLFWNQQRDAAKALGGILADGLLPSDQALLWSVLAQTQATGADAAHRASAQLARIRFLDVAADAKVDDLPEIVRLSLETPPDRASQQDRP